jgi:2-dehydro-3-deoxyphosphogluconate aldolase/(4S)-4-hydroxy-2-oxoglutarate aldolase
VTTEDALAALAEARFVPVLRASDADKAIAAGRALARGGCRAIEVTFTTPGAARAIATLVAEGHFVGAGTVLDMATAVAAWSAGASFIVSPHLQAEVLARGLVDDRLVIPGALTPSEVLAAHQAGASVVKIFPVASLGGPRYLKLLRDPLPFLRFFPTGGVTLEDLPAYLAAGALAVGVGSALAPAEAIEAGDVATLEASARRWG